MAVQKYKAVACASNEHLFPLVAALAPLPFLLAVAAAALVAAAAAFLAAAAAAAAFGVAAAASAGFMVLSQYGIR